MEFECWRQEAADWLAGACPPKQSSSLAMIRGAFDDDNVGVHSNEMFSGV